MGKAKKRGAKRDNPTGLRSGWLMDLQKLGLSDDTMRPRPNMGGVSYKRVKCCNPKCPGHVVV